MPLRLMQQDVMADQLALKASSSSDQTLVQIKNNNLSEDQGTERSWGMYGGSKSSRLPQSRGCPCLGPSAQSSGRWGSVIWSGVASARWPMAAMPHENLKSAHQDVFYQGHPRTAHLTRSAGSMAERLTTTIPTIFKILGIGYQEVPGSTPGWIVFLTVAWPHTPFPFCPFPV